MLHQWQCVTAARRSVRASLSLQSQSAEAWSSSAVPRWRKDGSLGEKGTDAKEERLELYSSSLGTDGDAPVILIVEVAVRSGGLLSSSEVMVKAGTGAICQNVVRRARSCIGRHSRRAIMFELVEYHLSTIDPFLTRRRLNQHAQLLRGLRDP